MSEKVEVVTTGGGEEVVGVALKPVEPPAPDAPKVEATPQKDPVVDETSLEGKVLTQVEYYFGDNNFPRDKFMKTECAKDKGWIKIDTMLSFNRLKSLVKDLSEEEQVSKIAEILKQSTLVDVDESDKKLRRNPDVPLDPNTEARTVYLKGFPKTETKLDTLLEYFKKFEGVDAVIMRWYKEKTFESDAAKENGATAESNGSAAAPTESGGKVVWVKKFKGSILVVFKTVELATKFLEEADVVFLGSKIGIKMTNADYKKLKREEYVARMEARNKKNKAAKEGDTETKNGGKEEMDTSETAPPKDAIVKGALFKIANIPANFSREEFKLKWYEATNEEDFKIVFLDFSKGCTEGVIRLEKEGSAVSAVKLLPDGKLNVGEDRFIDVSVLEGEEEEKYLQNVAEKKSVKRAHPGSQRGRGRGRPRGRGSKRRRY